MVTFIRLARVALVLALALVALSFVIGIGSSTTGGFEKIVLLGMVVLAVLLAARASTAAVRLEARWRAAGPPGHR